MSDSDGFEKVVDSSLSLALAPAFLKTAHDSLQRLEGLLDSIEPEEEDGETTEPDRHFARAGFLLLTLAQLEDVLKEACEELSLFFPTTLRLRDLAGHSDFDRCRKYIQKVMKSEIPSEAAWATLKRYRTARNTIAHRGRLAFSDGEKKKREEVERLRGIETAPPGVLVLGPEFASNLLSFGLSFLDGLHSLAKRLHDQANRHAGA